MSNLLRHNLTSPDLPIEVREGAEIDIKYSGYLERQKSQIEQIKRQKSRALSTELNYTKIKTLSQEAREKLTSVRPKSFGEAAQVPGVSKADLTALLVWLKIQNRKNIKKNKEMFAQDIEKRFYLEQSTTSHHLNMLKKAGITKSRKEGRKIYYSIDYDSLKVILDAFNGILF